MSTVTLFGAAALGRVSQADADRTLDVLLQYGVNHIDTAASYGDAEIRIGPWMEKHRKDFFLATKTGERTYTKAKEEIHRSLERMRTDYVDLLQLHNLGHPDEWDTAMEADGALEAVVEAKEQGLVRHIGVTGHGLYIAAMHLRSLKHFDFASVLLPYNYVMQQNDKYMADFEQLVKLCEERTIAVQTIKSLMRGPWGTEDRNYSVWYQPLTEQADIDRAVHWVIGRPHIFLNTAGDITLLPKILDAASRYQQRPSDAEMTQLLQERRMSSLFA
ncbi:MAG: aldo/keto reductase [Caldilineaceae bacterium]|nr:aldo/keto reductase [Caldilineaceae bacterium]